MSGLNSNEIGSATVRITADTSQVGPAVDEAKAKVQSLGDGLSDKAIAAGAIAATAAAAFQLGRDLEAAAEKMLGFKDTAEDVFKAIDAASQTPIENAKARVSQLRHELLDESIVEEAKRVWMRVWGFVNNIDLEGAVDQSRLKAIENAEARLANARATAQKEELQKRIAQEETATLEGAERIERKRQEAIRKAQLEFRDLDPAPLIDKINARYDAELRRLEELEARRKQAEDDRIAREKAQSEERERREREALDRLARQQQEIADKTAAAIASAFSKARTDFASALSMKDLVIGVQALNANLDNMRRNRQQIAAGDIYSG
jgi:hypothetical protein